ncbi:MAG: lycopene cyclase domain-containing protein [Actinomycetes bacterium]|jgi:lycopene cyclase domain-containing protein
MSYTQIAVMAVLAAVCFDRLILKTSLITRKAFWTSYAIILPFQLLTNWWLTSRSIVQYKSSTIVGWRIASAPVEDLFFGFALILGVLSLWVHWGKEKQK